MTSNVTKGTPEGGLRTKGILKESTPDLPLVSVITVVFNGEKSLEQTIRSVLSQDYKNIEYIIIDGGSTDRTLGIIGKHEAEIDFWRSEPDKGIYDAMNKGIALARGELIGFLNSDDYYEPNALAAVVEKFKANPGRHVLFGNTFILMEDLKLRYKAYSYTKYWRGMGIYHPAMFVQREVYDEVGCFDLNYSIAADFDFMLRAILKKVPFVPVGRFVVNYRTSGYSAINFPLTLRENRKILMKYFGFVSREHFIYLGLFLKSMTLILLQKIIRIVLGGKMLDKARIWYLKRFFAKEHETL